MMVLQMKIMIQVSTLQQSETKPTLQVDQLQLETIIQVANGTVALPHTVNSSLALRTLTNQIWLILRQKTTLVQPITF